MNHDQAVNLISLHTDPELMKYPGLGRVNFVSPAVSTVLAAAAITNQEIRKVQFSNECQSYADNVGLTQAVACQPCQANSGWRCGSTYSPLVKLTTHASVDACTSTIVNLLYSQLSGSENNQFVGRIAKSVGELHDNVPSHANGAGFSAAQVYSNPSRLAFAIADCGCGMLRKVREAGIDGINDDGDAIEWCLGKRNTTYKPLGDMPQKVPDDFDASTSPFPDPVETYANSNHHIGLGLWELSEMVVASKGSMWIWSGNWTMQIESDGRRTKRKIGTPWHGVAIELEFDIERARAMTLTGNRDIATVAGRIWNMNTIKIADRCGSIDIASRARAAQLRTEVLESVKNDSGKVVLDFAGVRTISGSFADELFAVLAADYGEQWFRAHIQVENLDDSPRETIREAIAERLAQPV